MRGVFTLCEILRNSGVVIMSGSEESLGEILLSYTLKKVSGHNFLLLKNIYSDVELDDS